MNLFERSRSRFNLVLCELHYTPIHGKTRSSCPTIEGHYLLIDRFDGLTGIILDDLEEYNEYDTDLENSSDSEDDDEAVSSVTHLYQIQKQNTKFYMEEFFVPIGRGPHKLLRNFYNIISQPNYIKPEIGECINLPTGEHIVIIKTMWIKIIQRKWKKVFIARNRIIKCRSCPASLSTRQLTGKWPNHCFTLPGLKCMLSNLK
jgi:hypothetical protein